MNYVQVKELLENGSEWGRTLGIRFGSCKSCAIVEGEMATVASARTTSCKRDNFNRVTMRLFVAVIKRTLC